ncbi:MAG: aminopeptidase [Promethearchaeota archaeon]
MPKSLGKRIVGDCLRIRESDLLWIHSWQHCHALAEEIAQEAQGRGASIMISTTSDALLQHVLKKAPQEALVTPPDHWRQGVAKATAFVLLEGPEDPGILKAADKGKALSIMGHINGVLGSAVSNKTRTLRVRTPSFTQKAARTYGISYQKWLETINQSLTANQAEMMDLGQRIVDLLRSHSSIHISTQDGTDLRFRIRRSNITLDDGVIDREDVQRKSFLANLPAGTVTVAVEESSTEGSIAFDLPRAFLGEVIKGLRFDFNKGQLVKYRALSNEATLTRAFRAAKGAKDRLGSITFGINPRIKEKFGHSTDELIQGVVTLGLGDNTYLGGKNKSTFSYQNSLSNAIVSIGPTVVIMEGKLSI